MAEGNDEIKALQEAMARQAKKSSVPTRFIAENVGDGAIIMDTKTMRTTEVPLFAFQSVRKALADLFPDENTKEGR